MMTGLILGGVASIEAIRCQIVIWLSIFSVVPCYRCFLLPFFL
ncbi:ABC transporter permease [Salipaludibacillus agaradhaerens]